MRLSRVWLTIGLIAPVVVVGAVTVLASAGVSRKDISHAVVTGIIAGMMLSPPFVLIISAGFLYFLVVVPALRKRWAVAPRCDMVPVDPLQRPARRPFPLLEVAGWVVIVPLLVPLLGWFGRQVAEAVNGEREWRNEAAPFLALGAEVRATGGGDMGYSAGRSGIAAISFPACVGDAELAALAPRMERFPRLEQLYLHGTKVTDAGLAHLKGLKQLRLLTVGSTPVTERGRDELRKQLPRLHIDP